MRALVDADSISYPASALTDIGTIRINQAYEEIIGKLIVKNNNYKFEDSNYSDLPQGTGDLVAAQQDYAFSTSYLTVERVEVKDIDGIWHKLDRLDQLKEDEALDEHEKTDGLPVEYAIRGNSIFLYPAPTAATTTLTAGLKVYFQRTASTFTALEISTGTKEPGFASPYHSLISYKAALPFALTYKKDRVPMLMSEIQRMERELLDLTVNRVQGQLRRLQIRNEDNR